VQAAIKEVKGTIGRVNRQVGKEVERGRCRMGERWRMKTEALSH